MEQKEEKKEKQRKKLPIDAKLLTDAVIELNISRRSVSLYPREHPITKESLEKAFNFLQKLFEIRSSITIGIAKDTLVVDEYTLERKNPVFREFALSIHAKGIAAITFYSGATMDELLGFHQLITAKDVPVGKAFIELAEKKGLTHIKFSPLDISKFSFIEGRFREKASDAKIWEDYIYGLLEGRLADSDAEGVILGLPPEAIADFINREMDADASEVTYDRVITTYLKRRGDSGIRSEAFSKFISMVQSLSAEIKQQFLKRAFSSSPVDVRDAEQLISELTQEEIERVTRLFSEHSSMIPESLRNIVDKLTSTKREGGGFDALKGGKALVDDVELDENIVKLFSDDQFKSFVAEGYQAMLERMLRGITPQDSLMLEEVKRECAEEIVDSAASALMLELIDLDTTSRDDFLNLLPRLFDLVNQFLETGRFAEISNVYNSLYSQALDGKFGAEASRMVESFFSSKETAAKMMDSFKVWGRLNREGVMRLAEALQRHLTEPLLDALTEESDTFTRSFLLSVLVGLKGTALPHAARRINDKRWYVIRNVLYLFRECGGANYVNIIRPLAKHPDRRVRMEALKTLLGLNAPGAFSFLRVCLESKEPEVRDQAVKLAGAMRVREAVPYLLQLLEKRDLVGIELEQKASIIRALGDIGDPRAVDTLERLYHARSLLFRNAMDGLRLEIFRSLRNYPPVSLTQLLEKGLRSENNEIRKISEEILNREKG
jgi:HEAT repeat protein